MIDSSQPDGQRAFARRVVSGGIHRVDVVMPYFNHGSFVEDAVESVRRQTHPVGRIIVVDDGSTDEHSKHVLADLESAGLVEVLRQCNQGPSSARNRGIEASSAEAVVLVDADDMLTPHYVEMGLAALTGAPDEVGFAYPDQQCFGTVDHLGIMPPYNLYMLSKENFCGAGCIVDRGVFTSGHRFREDLRHGHEDWEFYLRLGTLGIHGIDFHGAPLLVRRWGYSRSEDVSERTGAYIDEMRRLHPELFEPQRMAAVKRVWSPGLSLVLGGVAGAGGATRALARQTCDDYDVVIPRVGPLPPVRGRWVMVVDAGSSAAGGPSALLQQPELVERVLRIGIGAPTPCAVWLMEGDPAGAYARWQRVSDPNAGRTVALVVDGRTYEEWLPSAPAVATPSDVQAAMKDLAESRGPIEQWRWIGREQIRSLLPIRRASPERCPALAPPSFVAEARTTTSNESDTASSVELAARLSRSIEREREVRWTAPPLLFSAEGPKKVPQPPAGFVDGTDALCSRAWTTWVPSQTCALDLVVDDRDKAVLEVVYDWPNSVLQRGRSDGLRVTLGRLWLRRYPGTAALYRQSDLYTHRIKYRVSDGPPDDREGPLGYVSTEPLSETVDLAGRVQAAMVELASVFTHLAPPTIEIAVSGAFLEPDDRGGALTRHTLRRGRRAPLLSGSGGIGATLYELRLPGDRTRYTIHPDACVTYPDAICATAIAELGPVLAGSAVPVLQEVQYLATGGRGYVSGPYRDEEHGDAFPGPVLGTFASDQTTSVPLVRLRPANQVTAPEGEPGHRLAIDWEPLVDQGFVTEGVVGYVWRPDADQAPLYCWDSVDHGHVRLLTLGAPPDGDRSRWQFRGTFGLAWQPHCARPDLVDLWELRLGERITYAVQPTEFEAVGFNRHRVVARVALQRQPGALPLWRTALGNEPPWRFTTCPDEGAADGFVRQGIVCFIDPAHPPGSDGNGTNFSSSDEPQLERLVVGPVPFGAPLYCLSDGPGKPTRLTTTIPNSLDAEVHEIAGYLHPDPSLGDAHVQSFDLASPNVASGAKRPKALTPDAARMISLMHLALRRAFSLLPGRAQHLIRVVRDHARSQPKP